MRYIIANTLNDALKLKKENPTFSPLFGGTDTVLKLKTDEIKGIIDITRLEELKYIDRVNDEIVIGALTTINTIITDNSIHKNIPLLRDAGKEFASHQIRNIASLGGNIANASPVADLIAPLLVLETKVTLQSYQGKRTIPLHQLFLGFKSLDIHDEIITSFTIPIEQHQYYYRKVGVRAKLNISKLSLALVKKNNYFFISGASLNPYIERFTHLETLLNSGNYNDTEIQESLEKDISPSSSFRSTKEYRTKVLFNLIQDALSKLQ